MPLAREEIYAVDMETRNPFVTTPVRRASDRRPDE